MRQTNACLGKRRVEAPSDEKRYRASSLLFAESTETYASVFIMSSLFEPRLFELRLVRDAVSQRCPTDGVHQRTYHGEPGREARNKMNWKNQRAGRQMRPPPPTVHGRQTISCRTIRIPKEWEELGGTTIRTTSRQPTGGVTEKKDQPEWITDGRSVDYPFGTVIDPLPAMLLCANCVH